MVKLAMLNGRVANLLPNLDVSRGAVRWLETVSLEQVCTAWCVYCCGRVLPLCTATCLFFRLVLLMRPILLCTADVTWTGSYC